MLPSPTDRAAEVSRQDLRSTATAISEKMLDLRHLIGRLPEGDRKQRAYREFSALQETLRQACSPEAGR